MHKPISGLPKGTHISIEFPWNVACEFGLNNRECYGAFSEVSSALSGTPEHDHKVLMKWNLRAGDVAQALDCETFRDLFQNHIKLLRSISTVCESARVEIVIMAKPIALTALHPRDNGLLDAFGIKRPIPAADQADAKPRLSPSEVIKHEFANKLAKWRVDGGVVAKAFRARGCKQL
ncbi:MAG: hypothetical protein JKY60_10825, partial [Kordiimonadaceae bacterium]|nr:hypothetical protein [Kordiimonadaceae bacterium]